MIDAGRLVRKLCLSGLLLFLLGSSQLVFAQRQYNIVFMDISEAAFQDGRLLMSQLRQLRSADAGARFGGRYRGCFACKDNQDDWHSIGKLYLSAVPQGLTIEDAHAAIAGDEQARNRLQRILQRYNAPPYTDDVMQRYLSGLVLYWHEAGQVKLYALRALDATPVFLLAYDVPEQLSLADFDWLLERLVVGQLLMWNEGFTL